MPAARPRTQSINVSSPSVVVGACDAALRSTAFGAVSATHRACEQNHANGPTLDESTTAHMARPTAGVRWHLVRPRQIAERFASNPAQRRSTSSEQVLKLRESIEHVGQAV